MGAKQPCGEITAFLSWHLGTTMHVWRQSHVTTFGVGCTLLLLHPGAENPSYATTSAPCGVVTDFIDILPRPLLGNENNTKHCELSFDNARERA